MARSSSTETAPGAYGLAIDSDAGLAGIDAPSGATRATRHRVVGEGAVLEAAVTAGAPRLLGANGSGAERVEYHECGGAVLIQAGRYGDHLVGAGGGEVLSAVAAADPALWPGHVLGQALPLAASLAGLEVFHAGAVVIDGGVVALAGPSGAGKSTLVAALIAAGAGFFSDDVLAVEPRAGGLVAYPGTTLPGVEGVRRPLPLRAFLRLVPEPGAAVELLPCRTDRLLESTFDGISAAARRSLRLLDVAAALAPLAHELRFPPAADPEAVAVAVRARLAAGTDRMAA